MEREEWPLLGTVVDSPGVYEITEGVRGEIDIWYSSSRTGRVLAGYVRDTEVESARADRVPNICLDRRLFPALPPSHFRLRQAVGDLIRKTAANTVIGLESAP